MNATVMCEKCGKPLGVFDGNICADCSKIEQIRAEIEQDMLFYEEDNCNDKDTGFVMGLQHTLDIIDKHKGGIRNDSN